MTPIDDHLGLDPALESDFKTRTVRGGVWTLSAQAVRLFLFVASTMILSRLLAPEDYGLFGIVMGVVTFMSLFKDLGLGLSAVQAPNLTQPQLSALFWINVAAGILLAAITILIAPVVSWLYHDTRLTAAMAAMAGSFIAMGIGSQPQALLRRRLRLDIVTRAEIAATALACAVGVGAAWFGARYWALIVMSLVLEFVVAGMAWAGSGWRPDPPGRVDGVRPLLAIGGHMTGFNLMGYLTNQVDNLLVAWYWGQRALGFYAKAYQIVLLPSGQFSQPVAYVAHATLSRLRNQPARYVSYLEQYLLVSTSLGMPVIVFLFVSADLVIPVVLGSQWVPAIAVFRALAPAGFLMTFTVVLSWIFVSLGRTRRQIVWGIWTTVLTVASFLIGLPWGPFGVALAFSVCRTLLVLPNTIYSCHKSPVCWTALVAVAAYPASASVLSGAVTWFVAARWSSSGVPALEGLLAEGVIFVLAYVACWLALPSGRRLLATYVGALTELRTA